MSKSPGFTLVEVLVSVALTGMLLVAAYGAFQGIVKHQARLGGTIQIQKNLTYINEKMSTLIRDGGTIDYEEYFNRRMLGYDSAWITSLTPNLYTYSAVSNFGNGNANAKMPIQYCTVDTTSNNDACLGTNAVSPVTIIKKSTTFNALDRDEQPYGQYRALWLKYTLDTYPLPIPLPDIIPDTPPLLQNEWLPELYLIKKLTDGSYERTFFRHVFIDDSGSCDPSSGDWCLGKIQMTKLKSCDIDANGNIDLWIPRGDFDASWSALTCPTVPLPSWFDYSTAADDLLWVDVTTPDISVVSARYLPAPLKIPQMMSPAGEIALSPTIQIRLDIRLSDLSARKYFVPEDDNVTKILSATYQLDDE